MHAVVPGHGQSGFRWTSRARKATLSAMSPSQPDRNVSRVVLLSALPLAATIAVSVAGVWGIAVARRGIVESAERIMHLDVEARARAIESVLAGARADLAFLGNSALREPQLDEAGAALILFLRGHPEIASLTVRSEGGRPLLEAGRPRGVPGYWVPASRPAPERSPDPAPAARTVVAAHGPARAMVEALLDPAALLGRAAGEGLICELCDATGNVLGAGDLPPDSPARAGADVAADGWSPPPPWRVECATTVLPSVAMLEPVVGQYRTTLALNLLVMALAVALGLFAVQQTRRRQYLEDRAREEHRVREVERQLFHAERLSTAGRLAAGMAHEINNPLEGLSNYLALARDALGSGDGEAARQHLDRAGEGLVLAAGIVRRVLDHADRSTPPFTCVNLRDLLRQSVDFVRAHERFRSVRFDFDLEPGSCARGSQVMLGQVFLNLVLNACEAQGANGEVLVRSRRDGDAVVAEVADRGPGVVADERERIFEAFHSTKNSAGLGLSVCRSIVRDHGGELTVADRDGGGAVFRVRLAAVAEDCIV